MIEKMPADGCSDKNITGAAKGISQADGWIGCCSKMQIPSRSKRTRLETPVGWMNT